MLWSDAAGAPRGGLPHSVGDRRTLHNSCDSPTRCATAGERCGANGDPLVRAQRKRDDTRATQRRAGHHPAPNPTGVPLTHPARAPGGDEYRIDAMRPTTGAPPDPDPGRLDALPTELEDTFSAGEIAHAAPQVAPGPGDVALVQTLGVGLLLVQEAIGESVLAVEVRGHTDLAEHRRATTASWWSPSNSCTCLTCFTAASPACPGRAQQPLRHTAAAWMPKRVVARQGVDGQQLLQALLAPPTEGF